MVKKRKTAALFDVIARQQQQQVQIPGWLRRNRDTVAPVAVRPLVRLKQPPGLQSASASAVAEAEEDTLELPVAPPPAAPLPMAVPTPAQKIRRVAAPAAAPAPVAAPPVPVSAVKPPVAPSPAAAPAAQRPAQVGERITRIVAGRLRLSLGYPVCLAALLGLVVVLFGCYKLGQFSGAREAHAPAAAAANPIVQSGSGPEGFAFDKAQTKGMARYNADRRFVLVERNVANEADARAICEYLWQYGYVPVALQDERGAIVVCSMLADVSATADSLQKAAATIRDLGKKPAWKLRGQYSFAGAQTVEKKS